MLDPKQPLWLPQGSVRAILAIFTVVVGITYLIWRGSDPAETAIVGFVGLALGFYLAKQGNGETTA